MGTPEILDEIRTTPEQGDGGNLFYLYVATPGGAPTGIHGTLVKHFLQMRGWRKVSYQKTGFSPRRMCSLPAHLFGKLPVRGPVSAGNLPRISNEGQPQEEMNPAGSQQAARSLALYFCHKTSDGQEKAEAVRDRTELKNELDAYKELNNVDFKVHMVLSVPINYNEDFVKLTSQPGSIKW